MKKVEGILLSTVYVVVFILTVLSLAMAALFLFDNDGIKIRGTIIFVIFTVAFAYVTLKMKAKKLSRKQQEIENIIINIATPHNGLITSAELASNSSLSLKSSKSYLESCYAKGICEKKFTEGNLVEVYFFKSAITLESKESSKLISEM